MEGKAIGSRYRVQRLLGEGASGQVFAGVDEAGQSVAIKVLRPALAQDPELAVRFVRERSVLVGLRNPHLVSVRDLVVEGETCAIVMDLVSGPDLRQTVRSRAVALSEVAAWGAQVCRGLDAVHRAGIVHRDIKPENILLDGSVAPAQVRLTDFGIARVTSGNTSTLGTELIGTPFYMAPELWRGAPPRAQSDLYAVGVLLYELACGVPPFTGQLVSVAHAHEVALPGRPPGLPDELWDLLHALLAKEPDARPPNASATAGYLDGLVAPFQGAGSAPRLTEPPTWSATRRPTPPPTELRPPTTPAPFAALAPVAPAQRRPSTGKRSGLIALLICAALTVAGASWALARESGSAGAVTAPTESPQPSPASTVSPTPRPTPTPPARSAAAPAGGSEADEPACLPFQGPPTGEPHLSRELYESECREDVRMVQQALRIEDTGFFNKKTEDEVKAYQLKEGSCIGGADGRVGPKTWAGLVDGDPPC